MKKIISLLLVLVMLSFSFAGCTDKGADVWDGNIAEEFDGGKGTKSKPYKISSAEQLAYLAEQVNSGKTFAGKYFSLTRDINLDSLEWTPIGNGTYSFEGNFDGNENTISNLKISTLTEYVNDYHTALEGKAGVAGLFGTCNNATIKNVTIHNANVSTNNVDNYAYLFVGILVGRSFTDTNAKISNVKISSSSISLDQTVETPYSPNLFVGGLIGRSTIEKDASNIIEKVQCELSVSRKRAGSWNEIGGIVGSITNWGKFECSDFVSYLDVWLNDVINSTRVGALSSVENATETPTKISNAFSQIKINRAPVPMMMDISNKGYVIGDFGEYDLDSYNSMDFGVNGTVEFTNLFGCIIPSDDCENPFGPIYELTPDTSGYTKYIKTNCQGCESLPENHGLSKKIWDLSSLTSPKLK